VEIQRVPQRDAATLDDVVQMLEALPELEADTPDWRRPYLEVCVALPRPEPALRRRVEAALEGKAARLVKLTPAYTGSGHTLAEARPGVSLKERTPEDVFRARYARDYTEPMEPALLEAFHALLTQVQEDAS
jgi:exonuclease SbcD